jgi:23S rRNA (cytidine1920-2'-O)/16S rRNA (cytidine1409-2'-O)-methyltransferase
MDKEVCPYVSRGGLKLAAALAAFELDVTGWVCADLGSSTGGFVDCLLQHGAGEVYAIDTAYGELAWKLRQDSRVTVMERSNALHVEPAGLCDLVTIDLGWTRQARAIPAAMAWLKPGGRMISLVKTHYEAESQALSGRRKGRLDDSEAEHVKTQVLEALPALGVTVRACMASPIRGGKGGNMEFLVLLER